MTKINERVFYVTREGPLGNREVKVCFTENAPGYYTVTVWYDGQLIDAPAGKAKDPSLIEAIFYACPAGRKAGLFYRKYYTNQNHSL